MFVDCQGENYNYRDALVLSHYDVEELPAKEKDRVCFFFKFQLQSAFVLIIGKLYVFYISMNCSHCRLIVAYCFSFKDDRQRFCTF